MEQVTSKEIYEDLIKNVKGIKGNIYFNFLGMMIKVRNTDTVGKTLQEWLKEYLKLNDYYFREPNNTQTFPDFYLCEENDKNLLEIKSFHYSKTPAFDIANFDSYCDKIKNEPYSLFADYLVFGYEMSEGDIVIEEIWLKKIWEIAGTSSKYPLKTQIKRNMIYNIRPNSQFKRGRATPFNDKIDFLKAIEGTIRMYHGENKARDWKNEFCKNYKQYYKKDILF